MRFLVFVSVSLLSAGISHAQEPSPIPAEVFIRVAEQAKTCTYKTLVIDLDDKGKEKGEWTEPSKRRDVLKKLLNGDEAYMRPLNYLVGSVFWDPDTGSPISIDAELSKEIPYKKGPFTWLKLRKLGIYLEQRAQGEQWLPFDLRLTAQYWIGVMRIGVNFHEKYKATFECPAAEVAAR